MTPTSTGGAVAEATALSGQDNGAAAALVARVQRLTAELDSLPDPVARNAAREFMRAVMEMYGAGLAKVVEVLGNSGEAGAPMRHELINDGVFASLLLIHDLYPVSLEDRVQEALDSVRPYLESHGGNVEIVSVIDGVARLRMEGSCKGCPASASTLELAIRKALDEAAPDLVGLEVEGIVEEPKPAGGKRMLPMAGTVSSAAPAKRESEWFAVKGASDLEEGAFMTVVVTGRSLVVANVDGKVLAYENTCPSCNSPLSRGLLSEGILSCPSCDRRFFLPLAGRSLDDDRLHLAPVPLLGDQRVGVRVALAV
jgi:Fe-S cluster biogenesis protein NfuA/nitrite reductase/ring-hydroxylating ferredoxin subunit